MSRPQPIRHPSNSALQMYELVGTSLVYLSLICYGMSLFLPSLYTSANTISGYWILITGWIGPVFLQSAWYANPLFLLSIIIFSARQHSAILFAILAIILASQSFLMFEIPTGINQDKIYIKELGPGFFVWFFAIILLLAGQILILIGKKKQG